MRSGRDSPSPRRWFALPREGAPPRPVSTWASTSSRALVEAELARQATVHSHGDAKPGSPRDPRRGPAGRNDNEQSAVRHETLGPALHDRGHELRGRLASRTGRPTVRRVGYDRREPRESVGEIDGARVADDQLFRPDSEVPEVLESAPDHRGVPVDAEQPCSEEPGLRQQGAGSEKGVEDPVGRPNAGQVSRRSGEPRRKAHRPTEREQGHATLGRSGPVHRGHLFEEAVLAFPARSNPESPRRVLEVDPAPSGLERATAGEHRRVRSPARRLPDPSKRGRAAPGSFFPGGGFGVLRGSERYQTATRERETARESSPR